MNAQVRKGPHTSCYVSRQTYSRDARALEGTMPCIMFDAPDGCCHAIVSSTGATKERCEQVAKRLAIAYNSHDELLDALRDVLRIATAASIGFPSNQPRLERARAAIAKAQDGAA